MILLFGDSMEIQTYERLSTFLDRLVDGSIRLLIIESEAGLGKTHIAKQKLKDLDCFFVNSHITPLQCYIELYRHRDTPLIVLDDIFQLLTNRLNISLLKQLCDTSETRKICWYSTTDLLGNTPMEFYSDSRVLILCNSIESRNPHLKAVLDRGFYLQFRPKRSEILAKMREISSSYPSLEQEEKSRVLKLISANSDYISDMSLRTLLKGFSLVEYYKRTGVEWRSDFLAELGLDNIQQKDLLAY